MSKVTICPNRCYLCNNETLDQVEGSVRDYPHLKILKCGKCGLVFLDSFAHIDETYYENSKMLTEASLSLDKWAKENYEQNDSRAKALTPSIINKLVLDFGCGEGGFLNNIKPIAKACCGVEMAKILREQIVEKYKIQMFPNMEAVNGKFGVMTMFHVIEHLKDPIATLNLMKKNLADDGMIYIETPNVNDALLSLYENESFSNFTYWGCHLYLYSKNTLKTLIEKAGFKLNYIKQIQRYPLSNHLYWLSKGKPNGHRVWEALNTESLKIAYGSVLANLGIADTIIASISIKEADESNI